MWFPNETLVARRQALLRGMSGLSNKKDERKKRHTQEKNEFLKVHPASATQRGAHVAANTCDGGMWVCHASGTAGLRISESRSSTRMRRRTREKAARSI